MKTKLFQICAAITSVSFLVSCDEASSQAVAKALAAAASKAKPELIDHKINVDAWVVNGEFDYGAKVDLNLKNNGERGDIQIMVTLSSSEGEWTRTQNLMFDADETKQLSYVFTEPTVNASNIEYRIVTLPQATSYITK